MSIKRIKERITLIFHLHINLNLKGIGEKFPDLNQRIGANLFPNIKFKTKRVYSKKLISIK